VVYNEHSGESTRIGRAVCRADPIVHPPVHEHRRIVNREDVCMRLVHEVVREDLLVALLTRGPDHAYVGRIKA
jgi:hypothetical protein